MSLIELPQGNAKERKSRLSPSQGRRHLSWEAFLISATGRRVHDEGPIKDRGKNTKSEDLFCLRVDPCPSFSMRSSWLLASFTPHVGAPSGAIRRWGVGGLLLQSMLTLACGSKQFAMGDEKNCQEGQAGCVCTSQGSCAQGLVCERDLCVAKADPSLAPDEDPSVSKPSPSESSSQATTSSASTSSTQDTTTDQEPPPCQSDKDCENLDGPCVVGRCRSSACTPEARADQSPCEDSSACIPEGTCQNGSCQGKSTRFLYEDFASGMGTWTTDLRGGGASAWQAKKAQASDCDASQQGEDPEKDHSEGSNNMLAGTQIGACIAGGQARDWDCILSPKMDVSDFRGSIELSYWRHLHAPPNRINNRRGAELRVYAILDGKNPIVLEEGYKSGMNDQAWVRKSHKLEVDAKSLTVSFCVRYGYSAKAFAGWSLDDVRVRAVGCDPDQ